MATFLWQGHRLAYDDVGGGDGPPVVLLHGFAVCRRFWDDVVPAIAAHRRVLALDWIGYGTSSRPGRGIGLAGHAAAAGAFLTEVAGSQCYLVGHSMGASIAALVGRERSELIERLVLCNPLVRAADGLYPRSHRLVRPWVRPIVKRLLGLRPFVYWLASNSTDIVPIPEVLITATMAADREVMMRDALDLVHLDLLADLARLTMPVLLLGADRDAVVRPRQTDLAAGQIKDVTVHRFPYGHCPPLETPGDFVAHLEAFLDASSLHTVA
ncbi:MAG: alpha/beta hydrolase [Nitrospirota bacterium]|jgi:pimeloyl-ACP methyl ester carboxylesterase